MFDSYWVTSDIHYQGVSDMSLANSEKCIFNCQTLDTAIPVEADIASHCCIGDADRYPLCHTIWYFVIS